MANTITVTAQKANTSKPIEYLHPTTGVWQDSNVFTNVPAGIYTLIQARLKGSSPAITATWTQPVTVSGTGGTTPTALAVVGENTATGAQTPIGSASTAGYAGIWQPLPAAGTYDVYDTVTDAAGASKESPRRRVVVSAGTTSPAPVIIPINNTNTFFNAYRQASDVRSSFAESRAYGAATQVKITYEAPGYGENFCWLGVWDGNTYIETLRPVSSGTNVQTITLPGSGNRMLRFIDGGQQAIDDADNQRGSYITQLEFLAGSSVQLMQAAGSSIRLFAIVDSIGNGVNTTNPPRDSWEAQLRTTEPYDIIVDGWGYRSWFKSLGTAAKRTAQVNRAVAALAGAADKRLITTISTNDRGLNYASASQVGTIAGAFYDELHAADPSIKIYCHTPLYRKDIDMSEYTAALSGLASTRPWLTIVNTTNWLVSADLADDVHPNTSGQKKLAELIRQSFIGVQAVFGPGTYARVMGTENINPQQFTIIARIKTNSDNTTGIVSSKAGFRTVGGNKKVVGSSGFYLDPSTKKLQAAIYPVPDGSSEVNVVGNNAFEVGVYKNVAYSVDASFMNLRTDGQLDTRALNGAIPNSSNDLIQISGAPNYITNDPAEAPFDGILSNYSFFSRALSQAQIDDIFHRNCRLNQQEYEDADCIVYSTLARDNNATQLANIADASKPIVLYGATNAPETTQTQTIEEGAENYILYANGTWIPFDNANASGGRLCYNATAGDANYYELKFTGTKLNIYYQREAYGTMVTVLLDGQVYDTFDQHADASILNNVFTVTAPSAGTHTVRVRRTDSNSSTSFWADKFTAVNGLFVAR